jgi:type IV fimbrial biogenesis protein FimT
MITVAIMGVILAFAVPNINDFFDKKRLIKTAEAIYGELQYARTEALSAASNFNIATSGGVTVVFTHNGPTDWAVGTSVNTGCNTAETDPTASGACYIIKDDGDGVVDGVDVNLDASLNAATEVDTGDRVLRVISGPTYTVPSTDYAGVKMTAAPAFTPGPVSEITFSSIRGTTVGGRSGAVLLESDGGYQMQVRVGVIGQISICSPTGVGIKVAGYRDCL